MQELQDENTGVTLTQQESEWTVTARERYERDTHNETWLTTHQVLYSLKRLLVPENG